MGNSHDRSSPKRFAFTLIELLVVITIIALLIALLLPALQRAKRQVRVLTCLSNLKQLGFGIMTYVADDQSGEYPYPSSVNGNWIHYPGQTVDNLEALAAAAGYSKGDDSIWYCPLYHCGPGLPWFVETSPLYPDIYCKIFGVNNAGSQNIVEQSFIVPFLFVDSRIHGFGLTWDWSRSNNPDTDGDGAPDAPYRPGDSDAAIIMENNGVDSVSSFRKPSWSGHNQTGPYMESGILYGDGHAISRGVPEDIIIRVSPRSIHSY